MQPCTIKLPGFLQPWARQILVAGLQLRLLRGLPHPMCLLAADLSSAATAEAMTLHNASGAFPCHATLCHSLIAWACFSHVGMRMPSKILPLIFLSCSPGERCVLQGTV